MTDFDERIRNAIGVLAAAEPVDLPPLDFVHERIPVSPAPRRPRALVAVAAIGVLALAATAVGAAGLLPTSVDRAFHRISSWGKQCHVDSSSAQMLASYGLPDGRTLEWWRALGPRRADGTFASGDNFRILSPRGTAHDQAWACQTVSWPPEKLVLGGMGEFAGRDVIWGQAPAGTTAAVRAVYRDGTTVDVPLQQGRYFMTADPRAIARVEALDANGVVIAAEPNPTSP